MRYQTQRGREWLEDLFDAYHPRLLAFAVRRVGPDDAEDVVAEVFAVAWRRRTEVPQPELPWLYQTARNVVLHAYRRNGRQADLVQAVAATKGASAMSAESASSAVIDSVLDGLDPTDAEVLRLTVWEQLTAPEIAEVIGLTPGGVRTRLMRARRRAQELYVQAHLTLTH